MSATPHPPSRPPRPCWIVPAGVVAVALAWWFAIRAPDASGAGEAALLGAIPLAIGVGDGAELRQRLGISIVGGLIVSQLSTLYTTPVVYLYLDRFRLRTRGRAVGPDCSKPQVETPAALKVAEGWAPARPAAEGRQTVQLLGRRATATVALIRALGGGW